MRALIIDDRAKAEIRRVVDYAAEHRFDLAALKRIIANPKLAAGNDWKFVCHLRQGYRCVFSIENHPPGWCRHLSVSVDTPGKYPSPQAVGLLMQEFGFSKDMQDIVGDCVSGPTRVQAIKGRVWLEKDAQAVNVLEVLES